jgi:hypothetical protein
MTTAADRFPDWIRRKLKGEPTPGAASESPAEPERSHEGGTMSTTGGGSEQEPVVVWEASNVMEAEVVRGRLESAGIPAIIRGEALGQIYGLTFGGLAAASVLVPALLADKAIDLLTADLPEGDELDGDFLDEFPEEFADGGEDTGEDADRSDPVA